MKSETDDAESQPLGSNDKSKEKKQVGRKRKRPSDQVRNFTLVCLIIKLFFKS